MQDSLLSIALFMGLRASKLIIDTCHNLKSLNGLEGMPLIELSIPNCRSIEGDLSSLHGALR